MKLTEHSAGWRKSSYSGGSSGECLEVNDSHPTAIPVRDSKRPHGPALRFAPAAWTAFVSSLKGGESGRG
ncbi:DUF397 domain-containing protein [Streptomyces sp. NPDC002133]|uniref:DUF397 domain-containing protein n=1 Tax=Streptomyces sp. NPDC002133 TaxID=3154409 RepID=UPI00331CE359